jgi:radical SAM superfamily enzyme YgiQ (UPF0313 family)
MRRQDRLASSYNGCLLLLLVLVIGTRTTAFCLSTSAIQSQHRSLSSIQRHPYQSSSTSLIFGVGVVYEGPVYRPPAEWRSLILQVTIGCSWNRCSFCEMYQHKQFRAKSLEDIKMDLQTVVKEHHEAYCNKGMEVHVRDVFLADGDAMALPTKQLLKILDLIHSYLPSVRRISSYCLPRNLYSKSVQELQDLRHAGLSLVYVGCESGCNDVLDAIAKGETYDTSLEQLTKLQQAGIKRSIMILLGLGGTRYSTQHAIESAHLASASQPEFLSVLTTSFPRGVGSNPSGLSRTFDQENKKQ